MHTTFHADEQFSTPSFVRYDASAGSPDGRVSSALRSLPRALHSSQLNERSPYLDRSNDSRRHVEGSPSVRRPEEQTPKGAVYDRLFREADEVRARRDVAKEQSVRRELSRCRSAPKISEMGHNIPRDTDIVVRLGNLQKEKKALDDYKRAGNEIREQEILDQWFKPTISSKGRRTESKVYKDDLRQSRIAEYERRAEESRHERIQKEIEETYGSPVINPRSEQLARRADAKDGLSGMTRIEAMLERDRIAQMEKWERHVENDAMARGAATPQITKYAASMRRDKSAVERLWEDGQNRSKRQEERERQRQEAEERKLQEEQLESNKYTPQARRRQSAQRDRNEASPPNTATNRAFGKRSQSGNRSPAPTQSKLSLEHDNTYGNYSNNSAMDAYGAGNERAGDADVPVLPLPPAPRLQSGSRSMARSDADQAFLARTGEYARRREEKIRQLTDNEAKSMHSPLINPVSELIASRLPHSTMERLTAPKRESSSASPTGAHRYQEPEFRNDGALPRNTPHRDYNEVYESGPGARTESDLEASWGAARSLNARGSNADRIDSRHSSMYDAADENEYSSAGSPKRKKMSAVQRDGDVYQRMANWMQRKEQKLQQLRADLQRDSADDVAGELSATSQPGGRSRLQGASTHSHPGHETDGPSEYIPSPNRYQPGSSVLAARQASYVSSAPSTLLSPKRQQENLVSPKKDYEDANDAQDGGDIEDYGEDSSHGTPVESTPHAYRPHKVLPTEPTTPRGLTVGRDASGTPFTAQFSPKPY